MGRFTLLALCLFATGCAASHHPAASQPASPQYSEASASALAFDPPIAEGAVHPELARGPRARSAIFGYQQSTIEIYSSATDDQQNNQWGDLYVRDAVTVKSTVNVR